MDASEREVRARVLFFRDMIRYNADEGDPYAKLLDVPDNPYPYYEEIRRRGRLVRSAIGTYVTADHRLANEVLRDRRFGVRKVNGDKVPELMSFDNSMLGVDPPDHTRLRKLTIPTFNPRMADRWRVRATEICEKLADGIPMDEPFNLMTAYAQMLPITVIADLVGIPDRYRGVFYTISRRMAPLLEGVVTFEQTQSTAAAVRDMTAVFVDIIAARRADPQEDMITRMLPMVDEGLISMAEFVPLCMFLPLAGSETTVNLIGNAVLALLHHPDQWRMLVEQPELAEKVVAETLRYEPPVHQYRRVAHQAVEVGGLSLPVDSELAILAAGCNRDPALFDDPDRFDITRTGMAETLSFSAGIHYCLGSALAKLEAEVALQVLVSRMPRLRRAGPVRRAKSFIIRGMREFPLATY